MKSGVVRSRKRNARVETCRMNARFRAILSIAILTSLVLQTPPVHAAISDRTDFYSETPGLPVSMVQGQWREGDGEADLAISGGHHDSYRTRFRANFRSEPTPRTRRAALRFTYVSSFVKADTGSLILVIRTRARPIGKRWRSWRSHTIKVPSGNSGEIVEGGHEVQSLTKRSWEFEWRMVGRASCSCSLGGAFSLSL